jgi:hypothetical protein
MTDLTLRLISLECLDEQDGIWSDDEVYLNFNGARIWSDSDMDKGETRDLTHLGEFAFVDVATLTGWEDDPGSGDDLIGSRTVTASDVDGHFLIDFKSNGAHYHIYADVDFA